MKATFQNQKAIRDHDLLMAVAAASAPVAAGVTFLPSCRAHQHPSHARKGKLALLKRTRGGGVRIRRPSADRTRTKWPWMAHETQ
jgi:hypothetical protein